MKEGLKVVTRKMMTEREKEICSIVSKSTGKELRITYSRRTTISFIDKADAPFSVAELKKETGCSDSYASRLINILVQCGILVESSRVKNEKRYKKNG